MSETQKRSLLQEVTGGIFDVPPLELLTAEQAEAALEREPQIIQRVKGAKYILEIERYDNRPIPFQEIERIRKTFDKWLENDAPFLIVHRPARISVILLPEDTP